MKKHLFFQKKKVSSGAHETPLVRRGAADTAPPAPHQGQHRPDPASKPAQSAASVPADATRRGARSPPTAPLDAPRADLPSAAGPAPAQGSGARGPAAPPPHAALPSAPPAPRTQGRGRDTERTEKNAFSPSFPQLPVLQSPRSGVRSPPSPSSAPRNGGCSPRRGRASSAAGKRRVRAAGQRATPARGGGGHGVSRAAGRGGARLYGAA